MNFLLTGSLATILSIMLTNALYSGKVLHMNMYSMSVMEDDMVQQFARSLLNISDKDIMQSFLRDVMTEKEIMEISARFEAAKMLADGAPYTDIIKRTRLSSRTVARISDWLQNGAGGYQAVISGLHHAHLSPETAQ